MTLIRLNKDDDNALVEFFRQLIQAQAPTSLERARIYQNNIVDCHGNACRVWRGFAAATKTSQCNKMAADLNILILRIPFPVFQTSNDCFCIFFKERIAS